MIVSTLSSFTYGLGVALAFTVGLVFSGVLISMTCFVACSKRFRNSIAYQLRASNIALCFPAGFFAWRMAVGAVRSTWDEGVPVAIVTIVSLILNSRVARLAVAESGSSNGVPQFDKPPSFAIPLWFTGLPVLALFVLFYAA